MQIKNFYASIEKTLASQIRGNYPHDWYEDFITRSILKELRQLFEVTTLDIPNMSATLATKICWEVYKLTGKAENKFGDIAIIVNSKFRSGELMEGVAFLEAKKRTPNTIEFDALDMQQIQRINKSAHHSMLLLYDYDPVLTTISPWNDKRLYNPGFRDSLAQTHAVVVPTDLVLSLNTRNNTLYGFSSPFAYQLCFRYMQGMDLEFDSESLQTAKGYAIERGFPRYIMYVSVGRDGVEPNIDININQDLYEKWSYRWLFDEQNDRPFREGDD